MSTALRFLAVFGLLLLGAAPAQAAENAWTIYAIGGGSAVFEVFSGVAMILERGGSGVASVMTVMAIVGIIMFAARIGTTPMAVGQFMSFLILVFLISVTTFNIKVPVAIADRVNNYYNVVESVPLILAVPASLISQAGDSITEKIETVMSTPDEMKLTNGGRFNIVAKVVADGAQWRVNSPELRMSISNYIADCAIPGMARKEVSLAQLRKSTNIWADLKFTSEAVLTRYQPMKAPGGDAVSGDMVAPGKNVCGGVTSDDNIVMTSCTQAHACIQQDIEVFAEEFLKADLGDLAGSGVAAPLSQVMTSSYTWLTGGGGASIDAASGLRQRIMANSLSGAFRSAAAQAGNNELITTAAITQAEETQKTGWVTGAAVFNDLMGYIFIVLQVVIYGLAPFVAMLILAPGFGMRMAFAYLQMLIWVALWEPLIALVNFVVALFAKATVGQTVLTDGGFTFANSAVISEQANNLMMAAGFMGTMVPVLAWQVAKGTMGLMEFVSGGGGASAAAQAGATASTGNMSLGNVSMGSVGMNKTDLTQTTKFGFDGVVASNTPVGQLTRSVNAGGQSFSVNNAPVKSEIGSNMSVTESEQRAIAEQRAASVNRTAQTMQTAQEAVTSATQRAHSSGATNVTATMVGQTLSDNESRAVAQATASSLTQQEQHLDQMSKSAQASIQAALGLRGSYDERAAMAAASAMGGAQGAAIQDAIKADAAVRSARNGILAGLGRAVAGGAAGAATGSMAGPWGAGVGAVAGALAGAVGNMATSMGSGGLSANQASTISNAYSTIASEQSSLQATAGQTQSLLASVGISDVSQMVTSDMTTSSVTSSSTQSKIGQMVQQYGQQYAISDTRTLTSARQQAFTSTFALQGGVGAGDIQPFVFQHQASSERIAGDASQRPVAPSIAEGQAIAGAAQAQLGGGGGGGPAGFGSATNQAQGAIQAGEQRVSAGGTAIGTEVNQRTNAERPAGPSGEIPGNGELSMPLVNSERFSQPGALLDRAKTWNGNLNH